MRIVLMGPPGAGKGTQAVEVAAQLGVPHISTGEIFRSHLSQGTPLGIAAGMYMERGNYVPDRITNAMVRNRLAQPDAACAGFDARILTRRDRGNPISGETSRRKNRV